MHDIWECCNGTDTDHQIGFGDSNSPDNIITICTKSEVN